MGALQRKSASPPGLIGLVREFLPPEDVEAIYGPTEPVQSPKLARLLAVHGDVLKQIEAAFAAKLNEAERLAPLPKEVK